MYFLSQFRENKELMTKSAPLKTTNIVCSGDIQCPHPRVYLAADAQGVVVCPYCSKSFGLRDVERGEDAA